jgi:hypothetical protein
VLVAVGSVVGCAVVVGIVWMVWLLVPFCQESTQPNNEPDVENQNVEVLPVQ